VTDDADEELVRKRIHHAPVGEIRRLRGEPGRGGPVTATARPVASAALTVEQRLACSNVLVRGRRGDGACAGQGEDDGCNGQQQRDEADGDD
jgi:hypothetical protein